MAKLAIAVSRTLSSMTANEVAGEMTATVSPVLSLLGTSGFMQVRLCLFFDGEQFLALRPFNDPALYRVGDGILLSPWLGRLLCNI